METSCHRSAMLAHGARGTCLIASAFYEVLSTCLPEAVLKSDLSCRCVYLRREGCHQCACLGICSFSLEPMLTASDLCGCVFSYVGVAVFYFRMVAVTHNTLFIKLFLLF